MTKYIIETGAIQYTGDNFIECYDFVKNANDGQELEIWDGKELLLRMSGVAFSGEYINPGDYIVNDNGTCRRESPELSEKTYKKGN